mmetsp:Transcript_5938/g.14749  ORF Transcript_5938/g.14749 Transcript_5938/m.14749 type:complete len:434 (-) Transcript_5938:147-1448(-)
MDGWIDAWMDGLMHGWMNRFLLRHICKVVLHVRPRLFRRHRLHQVPNVLEFVFRKVPPIVLSGGKLAKGRHLLQFQKVQNPLRRLVKGRVVVLVKDLQHGHVPDRKFRKVGGFPPHHGNRLVRQIVPLGPLVKLSVAGGLRDLVCRPKKLHVLHLVLFRHLLAPLVESLRIVRVGFLPVLIVLVSLVPVLQVIAGNQIVHRVANQMNRLVDPLRRILHVVLAADLGGGQPGVTQRAPSQKFLRRLDVLVGPAVAAAAPAVRLGDDVLAVGQRAMVEGGLWVRHVGSLWVPGVDRQRGRCPGAVVCLDAVVGGKGGVGGPGHHSHGEGRSAVGKGGQPGDARIHGGGDVVLEKVVVFFVFVLRIVLGITVQVRYGSGQRFRIRVVIRVLAPLTGDSHVGIAVGIVVVAVVVVRVCAIPFPPSSNRIYRYSLGFP